jgi:hypothetical protein
MRFSTNAFVQCHFLTNFLSFLSSMLILWADCSVMLQSHEFASCVVKHSCILMWLDHILSHLPQALLLPSCATASTSGALSLIRETERKTASLQSFSKMSSYSVSIFIFKNVYCSEKLKNSILLRLIQCIHTIFTWMSGEIFSSLIWQMMGFALQSCAKLNVFCICIFLKTEIFERG